MANKDATIHFRTTPKKKEEFERKFSLRERSKVLRFLLEQVLMNKIVIPTNIFQE